jgi:hypothetical protein
MTGKRSPAVLGLMVLFLFFPAKAPGQSQEATGGQRFKPGLYVEYFSRTISWDENTYTSCMKATLGALRLEWEIRESFAIAALAGLSFSNFNGLVFRKLPFSIEYEAGSIGGLLLGADVNVHIGSTETFAVDATGQFVMSLGNTRNFDIPGLNQPGGLDGKATWMRFIAGPVLRYLKPQSYTPYVSLMYYKLWGTFVMDESLQNLAGTEEKKIAGRGLFIGDSNGSGTSLGLSIGAIFDPSPFLSVKTEIAALPYKKLSGGLDVDYGFSVKGTFMF